MERYVAFLRGINLGNRRVKSAELVAHFEAIGMAEVATFRASGNVVFVAPGGEAEGALRSRLEEELDARLGYDVAVFLRSAAEVTGIAARDPFPAAAIAASKGKPQVLLLGGRPGAKAARDALALAPEGDLMVLEDRELHWLPSVGLSETEVDMKALDAALGRGTMRTAGTIEQIAAKYCR
ncbi:MAG: DUF1697 domain-containing protein [Actinobacteria bacterium]|nr:DUF1697 domain-containing protein [Actinomycetota bacterium]